MRRINVHHAIGWQPHILKKTVQITSSNQEIPTIMTTNPLRYPRSRAGNLDVGQSPSRYSLAQQPGQLRSLTLAGRGAKVLKSDLGQLVERGVSLRLPSLNFLPVHGGVVLRGRRRYRVVLGIVGLDNYLARIWAPAGPAGDLAKQAEGPFTGSKIG